MAIKSGSEWSKNEKKEKFTKKKLNKKQQIYALKE
jgi:hypothetical protein